MKIAQYLVYVSMTFRRVHGYCDIGLRRTLARTSCKGRSLPEIQRVIYCFNSYIVMQCKRSERAGCRWRRVYHECQYWWDECEGCGMRLIVVVRKGMMSEHGIYLPRWIMWAVRDIIMCCEFGGTRRSYGLWGYFEGECACETRMAFWTNSLKLKRSK